MLYSPVTINTPSDIPQNLSNMPWCVDVLQHMAFDLTRRL